MSELTGVTEICRTAASLLIASTWETVVLAAGIACALALLPRISASMRSLVWTVALGVFVALPAFSLLQRSGLGGATGGAALHVDSRWSLALISLWAALSLVRAGELIASAIRLRAISRRAVPLSGAGPCTAPGTTRTAVLCTSDDVARPSVLGFFSPRILIPAWLYARLSPEELKQIVLHEMQHLRRRDDWVNLLQKVGLILFPLNPALLWVERRLCLERELACDDSVLALTQAPKAYATCLVNLAEHHLTQSRLSLALGAWERRSELARRVHAILRKRRESMGRGPANAVAAALVLAMAAGAAALSRSPELVSFADAPTANFEAATSSFAPAQYQPVSFHLEDGAHATYLKAVMPEGGATVPKKHHAKRKAPQLTAKNPAAVQVTEKRSAPATYLTLTTVSSDVSDATPSDSQDVSNGPRVIFTVIQGPQSSHSYAAVPTPGGWLIFQL